MTLQMLRRSMLVLALAAPLASAPTAGAAITTTSVVTPTDGSKLFVDSSAGSVPINLTISGTSDSDDPADQVQLRCYSRVSTSFMPGASIGPAVETSDIDGSWSVDVDLRGVPGGSCLLRAIPVGAPAPATLLAYTGPSVYFANYEAIRVAAGINAGKISEWELAFGRADARGRIGSPLTGLGYVRHISNPSLHETPPAISSGMRMEGQTGDIMDSTAGLMVDGAYAWHPEAAAAVTFGGFAGGDLVGFPGIDVALVSDDPATGAPGAVESYPIVRCNAGQHLPNPDAACTQFVDTGVRVTRTFSYADGARTARVRDVFSSTDGAAHTVSVQYIDDFVNVEAGDPLGMSWVNGGAYAARPNGDVTPPPSGPWSMRAIPNVETADGDLNGGRAARVISSAPDAVRFGGGTWTYQERHQVAVPGAGSATVESAFIAGVTQSEVDARVSRYTDLFAPPALSVLAPTSGSTSNSASVAVTGTATDNVGIASVTVNGVAATVAPGGAFTANATLALGANTITVVASDAAGNATTASVVVTRTAPPVPPVTPTPPQVRFVGTAGADTLRGNAVGNVLLGLGGNDRLFCGAGGRDTASGGAGNDRVDCVEPYAAARANRDTINCGGGTKDIVLADPFDVVKSCELVTRVWTGAARADRWRGTRANDRFNTLAGNDSVTCGGGRDTASLGAGNDTVNCADTGSASARRKSRDIVNCGAGRTDRAIVDRYDIVRFCERVTRR